MVSRTPIYGVDFSGARDAGKMIWIASGVAVNDRLRIDSVASAAEKFGTGPGRDRALRGLVEFIAGLGDAVVGCDFPFSLPQQLLEGAEWHDFVLAFGRRHPDADRFREWSRAAVGPRELKRMTDEKARTPFCGYNLRLYRQTYYGIRDVLAPLASDDAARVLPMQRPRAGLPSVIEVCPASLLKRLGHPWQKYKGRTPAHREQRVVILDGVLADGMLAPPGQFLRDRILSNTGGDALDAVLAAVAAFRAGTSPDGLHADLPPGLVNEGWVYV